MNERASITLSEFKEKVKETLTLFSELPEEQKQEALLFWSHIVSQAEKCLTDQRQIKTEVPLVQTKEVKGKAKRRRGLKLQKLKTVNNEVDLSIPSVAEAEAVSGLLEIQNKSDSQILNGQDIREENVQIIHLNSDGKSSEVKIENLATEVLTITSNHLEEFAVVATPEPVYIYPGLSPLKYDTPLASYGSDEIVHIQIEKTDGKIQNYVVKPVKNAGKGKQLDLIEEGVEIAEDNWSDEVKNEEDSENEENSSDQTQCQKQKCSEKYLKCKKCSKLLSSSSALNTVSCNLVSKFQFPPLLNPKILLK
ncbi:hypothetical protein CHS0354_029933 [Potamilus streckersoni]|uniref:Uncharacterized protein n=1 Tax=Potamilus streckersoni TaxID=2493646 RepID=A0AAE0VIF6_9BIVA|nr:hypothetical protein CHS0354_029933 [Potamilus streckersoni]